LARHRKQHFTTDHPLTKLKPIAKQASISSQLKTMAPDKILEVQAFIDSLTKKEDNQGL
jgi:hypothetical protein